MGGWLEVFRKSTDRRKTESERIKSKVEKEDFLLSQIDEFREKAKQLQTLLATKENKVQELQDIVEQREGKATQLQNILDEQQDEADRIIDGVRDKMEGMASKVDAKMKELNETFAERLAENAVNSSEQNEAVKKLIEEQNEKLNGTVQGLNGQFEQVKNEICEKVHTENVKCYRNIQTLFEESDEKVNRMKDELYSMSSVKVWIKVVTILAALNLVGLAVFIVYALGLI